jgi:alanyl-tRNA synthetase
MMGNWSLGDYFKKEAVTRSREFLTKYLEIDPRKIAVTVFKGNKDAPVDEDTKKYWLDAGMTEHKISYLSENRRSPGPVGPCGPDTEIFYRVGASEFPPEGSNVKDDEDNWLEIWNNVFMEYYRDES